MLAGRLRECLMIIRWQADDLADELGCRQREVSAWLDGRAFVPLLVAAWVEALVKAHRSLPRPDATALLSNPVARSRSPEIRLAKPLARPAVEARHPFPGEVPVKDPHVRKHLSAPLHRKNAYDYGKPAP